MNNKEQIVFVWVKNAPPRLAEAQQRLENSIVRFGLTPLRFSAGKKLVRLGDILNFTRSRTSSSAMVWCNSDVELKRNPYDVPDSEITYGFHRTEIPSENICCGIDMYYIPITAWDCILSMDIPRLYVGASFVDWWISRKMNSLQKYKTLTGYINHESHPKSEAAAKDANYYYRANLRSYNEWASRNGVQAVPCPPFHVQGLGYVWGARDAIKKLIERVSKK
jgi:hypothetical protein